MPEFTNPFIGVVPRKMTKEELIRAIRLNISAEHEAVHIYMAHADATDDPLAKKVLIDVANEEREHIGEFQQLLRILAPDEDVYVEDGVREVEEMQAELSGASGSESVMGVQEEREEESVEQEETILGLEEKINESMEEDFSAASESDIAPTKNTINVRTIGSLIDRPKSE